jgi:hypothetical protein
MAKEYSTSIAHQNDSKTAGTAFAGTVVEGVLALANDTGELGIYSAGAWYWYGAAMPANTTFYDEGGLAGTAAILNVTGAGGTISVSGGTATLSITGGTAGTGDVVGPASAVDGHLAVFDTTTGKLIKDGGAVPAGSSPDGWTAAGETWTYAAADAPSFTFTVAADVTGKYSPGMRVKLTQTTVKYFIITGVSTYSGGNTTITVYGGTDYTLANAAITSPYYSVVKAPQGFPLDPTKWTVTATDTTDRSQSSPTDGTWYNLTGASISIPVGAWRVSYKVWAYGYKSSNASNTVKVTLSTANNSASDANWTTGGYAAGGSGTFDLGTPRYCDGYITIAAKATYYLNIGAFWGAAATSLNFLNSQSPMVIRATCAYL